jgi:uncharacterized protein YebE (UPF0316 family)
MVETLASVELLANPWLLSAAIFVARVLDVSLGTLRTILVVRSYALMAAVLGFLEVVIWILAAGQVLQNLDRWYLIVAFAAGFAAGNVVGIWLESKLAVGVELVRAISVNRDVELARILRGANHRVIELVGTNGSADVEVLLITEKRRKIPALLRLIKTTDPEAVYTISDVKREVPEPDPRRSGLLRFLRDAKRK